MSQKKLYDLSKRCIIKLIDTEEVKNNVSKFLCIETFNFYGVRSQTQINHYGAKATTN